MRKHEQHLSRVVCQTYGTPLSRLGVLGDIMRQINASWAQGLLK